MDRIIKSENQTISKWSGGTTRELYLFPEDGSYAERRFQFRISSAMVDLEESSFTSLPGVARLIMPLKGRIKLFHTGHGERVLEPFNSHRFMGDWETNCIGKCTDFNLMLKEGDGEINAVHEGDARSFKTRQNCFVGYYCIYNNTEVSFETENGKETRLLNEHDFIIIYSAISVSFNCSEHSGDIVAIETIAWPWMP